MNIHTETDWASGMAAMKNMALAVMMAQEGSCIESLKVDLRKACPEGVWGQIWSHVEDCKDALIIRMPADHDLIGVCRFRNGSLCFKIFSKKIVVVEDLGEAFVLADRRIQKLLRQERRKKWSCWQWFLWLVSFTLAENS